MYFVLIYGNVWYMVILVKVELTLTRPDLSN